MSLIKRRKTPTPAQDGPYGPREGSPATGPYRSNVLLKDPFRIQSLS